VTGGDVESAELTSKQQQQSVAQGSAEVVAGQVEREGEGITAVGGVQDCAAQEEGQQEDTQWEDLSDGAPAEGDAAEACETTATELSQPPPPAGPLIQPPKNMLNPNNPAFDPALAARIRVRRSLLRILLSTVTHLHP
jgi:hypothetical protein